MWIHTHTHRLSHYSKYFDITKTKHITQTTKVNQKKVHNMHISKRCLNLEIYYKVEETVKKHPKSAQELSVSGTYLFHTCMTNFRITLAT